jgi:hypothetical protein
MQESLQSRSFTSWLNNTLPGNHANNFHDDLECFGVPFGALGFLSELVLLYTTCCLLFGVKPSPWSPFQPKKFRFFQPAERGWCNLLLGIATTITIAPLAVLTMIRCRTRWELVLVCIFRMGIGMSVGTLAIWLAINGGRNPYDDDSSDDDISLCDEEPLVSDDGNTPRSQKRPALDRTGYVFLWLFGPLSAFFLILGCILDSVAVTSLMFKAVNSHQIQMTTGRKVVLVLTSPLRAAAFYYWVIGLVALCGDYWRVKPESRFMFAGGICCLLVYSDFSIGDVAHRMGGVPSESATVVYWIYILVKRFPMMIN